MIEVRIRGIDDDVGTPLGEFYPDALDEVVQRVKRYGCFTSGDICKFTAAQFVADKDLTTKAYFEIVVETEDSTEEG